MSRILVLANSGFGKTFSIGNIPELGHKGLDPKETYIISVTSKPLTFPGSRSLYKVAKQDEFRTGNRYITNNPAKIVLLLDELRKNSPFKNILIDDFNYLMQDYYMDNALAGGWDCPKKIGFFMGKIFKAIEQYGDSDKNIIILAHGESVQQTDNRTYVKMKTTGRMVA